MRQREIISVENNTGMIWLKNKDADRERSKSLPKKFHIAKSGEHFRSGCGEVNSRLLKDKKSPPSQTEPKPCRWGRLEMVYELQEFLHKGISTLCEEPVEASQETGEKRGFGSSVLDELQSIKLIQWGVTLKATVWIKSLTQKVNA